MRKYILKQYSQLYSGQTNSSFTIRIDSAYVLTETATMEGKIAY